MKINISIEATPQEIREVFGLPDIQDVQGLFLKQLQQNLKDGHCLLYTSDAADE